MFGPLLDVQMSFRAAGARGLCTVSKVSKTWGFCSVAGAVQEACSSDVRRSAQNFLPERGCILEHQIFSFGKMILNSTTYDLASLFRGRNNTLDRWNGQIAKRIGPRPSALHSTFYFWRESPRLASLLMLSTSILEEVSQNCVVFDVVKFKN